MIKKQLADGNPCDKCAQTEDMLRRRELWHRIDEVVWVIEGDDQSPGAKVARHHGIKVAPFFVLRDEAGGEITYISAMRMIRDHLSAPKATPQPAPSSPQTRDLVLLAERFARSEPQEILRWALEQHGEGSVIAFRGSVDVALIDMATRLGLPFRVFTIDTGRLHPETHEYLDEVRRHFGIEIETHLPDAVGLSDFVKAKGMNSFFRDGHQECCAIRWRAPLERLLADCDAWISGDHLDDERGADPATPAPVRLDSEFEGRGGGLLRVAPLTRWSRAQVWTYIHSHSLPHNKLHDQGFSRIGCQPCTRTTRSDQPGRASRWWWEDEGDAKNVRDLNLSGDGI